MIDTLVIVVYNRFHNVEKWLKILQTAQRPKNVVVIQNLDTPFSFTHFENEGIIFINRKNIGFDIGAFQDVVKNRLAGFPEWEQLFWVIDDCFPMVDDYLGYFNLTHGEGVRCMEISTYVRRHIRTTAFSIRKETAAKLQFPADPVTTKQHCYMFEHRWHKNLFIDQVERMKLKVVQVAPNESSPMFDTGYHRRLNRDKELALKWGWDLPEEVNREPKVTIICPIYKSFPAVISSLIMQTFTDWKLLLIHDGPSDGAVDSYVRALNDDRIVYSETPAHRGEWGHYIRSEYLQTVDSEFVLITNPDNYYMPVFLENCLKAFTPNKVAAYCQHMVHSYKAWENQVCRLMRGHLDCGGVLLKTKEAQAVGWKSFEHSADWFFFADIIKRYGERSFVAVKGTLFVHN